MKKYRVEVDDDGNVYWYKFGTNNLHREDGPAIVRPDGTCVYYIDGAQHRVDGPAMVCKNGTKIWCQYGRKHREDGPAVEHHYGDKGYWIQGIALTEVGFFKYLLSKTETMSEMTELLKLIESNINNSGL